MWNVVKKLLRKILVKAADYAVIKLTMKVTQRDGQWLESRLQTLPNYGEGVTRIPLDSRYYLPREVDLDRIIKFDWANERIYKAERYDCDNFAFSFMARVNAIFGVNSIGLVIDWSSGHAYNIVVYDDGRIKLFEPQNDGFVLLGHSLYKFENGVILI